MSYVEEELDSIEYSKDELKEYYTQCATNTFKHANSMEDSNERLKWMKIAMSLFKYIDELVESSYKGKSDE